VSASFQNNGEYVPTGATGFDVDVTADVFEPGDIGQLCLLAPGAFYGRQVV
jgi:hypothetical protein